MLRQQSPFAGWPKDTPLAWSNFPTEMIAAPPRELTRIPLLPPARPALLAATALAVGIALGSWLSPLSVAAGLFAAAVGIFALRRRRTGAYSGLATLAAIGAMRFAISSTPAPDDVSRYADRGFPTLRGTVASDVDRRRGALSCQIAATEVKLPDGSRRRCSGRVAARLGWREGVPELDYGDEVEARGRLERPSPPGNEGDFDYRAYLADRGVFATLQVRRPDGWMKLPSTVASADWIGRTASLLRDSLLATVKRYFPKAEAGLLSGVLLGVRTDLPGSLQDDFVATGTVHVLATAGLHVGVFTAMVQWMLRKVGLRRRPAAAVALALLVLFTIMAGARPSILRAALVGGVWLFGILIERESDAASALGTAALIILFASPGYLFDAGFQLSFGTVGAILMLMATVEPTLNRLRQPDTLLSPRASRNVGWALHFGASCFLLSLAAQIGSAPFTALHFHQVSLIGVFANALIVPMLFPIIGGGFLLWLVTAVCPFAAPVVTIPLGWVLGFVIGVVRVFARLPGGEVSWPSPLWPSIAVYFALLGAGARWIVRRQAVAQ